MTDDVISPKKLIEVALPLDAINTECTRRKRKAPGGYPTSFHKWWAQRPVAAARAVVFGQLVHDPEDLWRRQNPGIQPSTQVKGHWTKARAKLFKILEDMILWENTNKGPVLKAARDEIQKAWRETCDLNKNHPQSKVLFDPELMPGVLDPFAGGGTIPLESQRLGLEATACDLNPVAVLISKAMVEIPSKFVNKSPVHPEATNPLVVWNAAAGMAADVRRYAAWIRDEAFKRTGHLYPPVEITQAMVKERPDLGPYQGEKLTVIAWIWARTVKSPNPAYSHIDVPLASTFVLSNKEGRQAYVHPIFENGSYSLTVKTGKPPADARSGTKCARGANFRCLMSQASIEPRYIKDEAVAGRLGQKLMAIVAEGTRGRVYLTPTDAQEAVASAATPGDAAAMIHVPLADDPRNLWCLQYGLTHFDHLFTSRQLVALTTFSDLVVEARAKVHHDAALAGLPEDERGLEAGGIGASAYADAITVYLWCILARVIHYSSTNCTWLPKDSAIARAFTKQAIPMSWDFVEGNVFAKCSTEWDQCSRVVSDCITYFSGFTPAKVLQADASQLETNSRPFVSTDPPYYDNVSYSDLSDFFYVWLRRTMRPVYPKLLSTISCPKTEELVASPYRHGGKDKAEIFFLDGMTQAIRRLAEKSHPGAPLTIYYAFKQSEAETDGVNSTGWETFLEAVNRAGLSVTGTWPMRTEGDNRQVGQGTNALASSIILVCRPRPTNAGTISRRQFVRQLNEALPLALDAMTRESEGLHSPVAPVDLSQAIIGPGMAIFSRYDAVLEADGTPMSVKTALQLINRFLAEDDFDADTQFCLHWFEQYGWDAGKFGEADTLARAKGTSVEGVKAAGVVESGGGNVRLLKWKEYPAAWDPRTDTRLPVWEALHQLIRAHNAEGDAGAARVLAGVAAQAEAARQLAYRLYTLCERAGRAEDARAYNEVVTGWSGIESAAVMIPGPRQGTLFE